MALNIPAESYKYEWAHEYTKLAIVHGLIPAGNSIEDTAENVAKFFNTLIGDV